MNGWGSITYKWLREKRNVIAFDTRQQLLKKANIADTLTENWRYFAPTGHKNQDPRSAQGFLNDTGRSYVIPVQEDEHCNTANT